MTTELILETVKSGGVVGILALSVWYFLNKEKKYKAEITTLQEELRNSEKESLSLIYKLAGYMERGEKNLEDLKVFIADKIDSLKESKNG